MTKNATHPSCIILRLIFKIHSSNDSIKLICYYTLMQKSPTIIQFEPDENYITIVDLIGYEMDFKVIRIARSVKKARKLFHDIEQGRVKPDIAIVSAYLSRNHKDGAEVATKLRELVPAIKIISYSVAPDIEWGDIHAIKSPKDNHQTITLALEELTGLKYADSNVLEPEEQPH